MEAGSAAGKTVVARGQVLVLRLDICRYHKGCRHTTFVFWKHIPPPSSYFYPVSSLYSSFSLEDSTDRASEMGDTSDEMKASDDHIDEPNAALQPGVGEDSVDIPQLGLFCNILP